jgi:hypothetical protein
MSTEVAGTASEAICVLGMHRSGTSMLARMIMLCGVHLGPETDLYGPNDGNPEGYWENKKFVELNNRVLAAQGGAWDVLPVLPPSWQDAAGLASLRADSSALVQEMVRGGPAWGWKDPRTTLVLPYWKRVVPHMRLLACVRDPYEVAESLRRRGYSSYRFGLRLWTAYNTPLLELVTAGDAVLTHYDLLLSQPRREIEFLARELALPASAEQLAAATATVSPRSERKVGPGSMAERQLYADDGAAAEALHARFKELVRRRSEEYGALAPHVFPARQGSEPATLLARGRAAFTRLRKRLPKT